jgi:hypothetical protein
MDKEKAAEVWATEVRAIERAAQLGDQYSEAMYATGLEKHAKAKEKEKRAEDLLKRADALADRVEKKMEPPGIVAEEHEDNVSDNNWGSWFPTGNKSNSSLHQTTNSTGANTTATAPVELAPADDASPAEVEPAATKIEPSETAPGKAEPAAAPNVEPAAAPVTMAATTPSAVPPPVARGLRGLRQILDDLPPEVVAEAKDAEASADGPGPDKSVDDEMEDIDNELVASGMSALELD